jgi:ABC-type glycerol-3-phosphate transport system substrate-binding protein
LPQASGQRVSRRRLLLGASALATMTVLQACASAPASPTAAPAAPAPTAPPQPAAPTATTAPAQPAAAQPTATTAAAPTAPPATATTASAATATPAPAAAAAPAPKTSATVTLWTYDAGLLKWMQSRWDEWAPTQTGSDLKSNFLNVPNTDTKELTTLAANQGIPELFLCQIDQFSKFQKGDIATTAFTDLTPLIKDAGGPENFVKLQPYSWKGKHYAVEFAASPVIYYYREDLFQEAGIKLPIETFDDLINEGQKLKSKGAFMEQIALQPAFWVALFDHYVEGRNGLGLFDQDGKVLLDSPEAIDALRLLSNLAQKKVMAVYDTPNAQTAGYQRNQIAGTSMADWYAIYVLATAYKDQVGKWRAQAMPQQIKGTKWTPTWGGVGTTVFQRAASRDLLLEFYRYALLTKENFAKITPELGDLPSMRSTWTLPAVADYVSEPLGGQKLGPVLTSVGSTLVDPGYGPFWNEHLDITAKAVNAVLVDQAQPEDALKSAAKEMRDIIAAG